MKNIVIGFIGNDIEIAKTFNYVFFKGISKSNLVDYIMNKDNIEESTADRFIDIDKIKHDMFMETFSLDEYKIKNNPWYNYKNKKYCVTIETNDIYDYNRIYNDEMHTLEDIKHSLGCPTETPYVKINELYKIYVNSIKSLFGDVFLYRGLVKAYESSVGNGISFVYNLKTMNEVFEFRRAFPSTGNVVDITGVSKFPVDYRLKKDIIQSNDKTKIFYHVIEVVKFILI